MSTVVEQNGKSYMMDQHKSLIPMDMIKEVDLLRDNLVMEIVKRSVALSKMLTDFKRKTMADIQAFVDLSAEKYGATVGGAKGNVQLLSFDGEYRVQRSINDYIVFDERLQVAKTLIDECVREWSVSSRSELQLLVNHAFEVDKKGCINTDRVLSLRRVAITDAKWKKAMDAISDSIQVTGSKAYVRIYKRNADGKYEQINLDLAAL